jgi:transcriptional regulator with XRE-family HTH domain
LVFVQALHAPKTGPPKTGAYTAAVARGRKPLKPRPEQGARIAAFRRAAGLTQVELAELLDVSQQIVAFWEQSERPPRSDILPQMAQILGVTVEQLVYGNAAPQKRSGPAGKLQKVFEEVARLPRRQQDKVVDVVTALVDQYRKSG